MRHPPVTSGPRAARMRGTTLIELVVGTGLALLVLGACVGALAATARLVAVLGARAEVEDTAQLAVEAFRFDVRRAGFDPTASGIAGLAAARADRLTLQADLDADGTLDASSEEVVHWVCATAPSRLSRVIGAQSMPLAAPTPRCTLYYLDGDGIELASQSGGLTATECTRVRRIVLDLEVAPARGGQPASRRAEVALRVLP